ncbi:hypothetical protein niasHS_007528 [Heterodera schachtii]|uniref:RING-type domain-containing protein n=1 Tax=Heterodera schachtii TaxID=97005 RepID=A0ABD2JXS5_HETSC
MRHVIPHLWKRQCDFPKECANFYLDTHSISSERMTGWVKLWRFSSSSAALPSSDQSAHWLNAWAVIDDNRLYFYDSDQLAVSEGTLPFLSIDLDRDHWRIYNQTTDKPLDGIRGTEMPMLIELKLPDYILFMLAPTVQAKQRLVYSLQMATSRRVFVQRRRASTIVTNSLLLALDKPLDLSINSTVILRDEGLLLGAQEGLFATPMSPQQLRAPLRIAGVSCVYWMELLPEFDMLLTICGSARQLAVIHLQQILRAFKVAQHPTMSCTNIANVEQCHIAMVSNSEHHRDKRFVYIATIDEIIVLQYVAKLGFFSPVAQIKTEEPCTCICSASFGFVFGADNFHFARFDFAMHVGHLTGRVGKEQRGRDLKKYKRHSFYGHLCMLCLQPLFDDVVTLACQHVFHFECLRDWRAFGNTMCVLCGDAIV